MIAKCKIDENILILHLNKEYGIQISNIEFIPMGDSAYSYRVNCVNGDLYYLKLFDHKNDRQREGVERLNNYLPLIWKLHHNGLYKNISYPIKKQSGDFKSTFNDITLVLFNFIKGKTLAAAYPFSKGILKEVAKEMANIHRITNFLDTTHILKETYDIPFESNLLKCITVLESSLTSDTQIKQILREQVLSKKEQIIFLLNLVCELRGLVIKDNKDKVLCHGDIWGGNLIRHKTNLFFIDWESTIIAPPEFDLFGFLGEGFDVFLSSYKKNMGQTVTLNIDLFRYYSYCHHLRNLTNWLMNILYRNTEETQNENDLEMILHHCLNRLDSIESKIIISKELIERRI
ncbi:phosphotransferase [Metabacillus dongyingensis]|uniref:phosphotransferase n=1 Tax=Metabacillus dongyingensis TaxID=2874282 RepID=UPI003B8BFF1C